MRRAIAMVLIAASAVLGAPMVALAQTTRQMPVERVTTVSGRTVDAAGRPVAGRRVELVQGRLVLQTTMTDAKGAFTFAKVTLGDYVLRVVTNGTPAGIKASVATTPYTGATIVLPSSAAPSGAFLGPLAPVILAGAVATFVAVAATGGFNDNGSGL
ncbi:MAG: hypothetical protein AMXMBFR57_28900 [Acidimicrobiia bacterium]